MSLDKTEISAHEKYYLNHIFYNHYRSFKICRESKSFNRVRINLISNTICIKRKIRRKKF